MTVSKKDKTSKKPRKLGRIPRVTVLDEERLGKIRELARAGCTKEEIRKCLGVSNTSFWGSIIKDPMVIELIDREIAQTKFLLRKKQLWMALNQDNVQMLIHLGKHMLDQNDKTEIHGDINHDFKTTKTDEQIIEEFIKKYK